MKNIINYYYNLNIENIHLTKGIYYFKNQNQSFMLTPFYQDEKHLLDLYQLNQKLRLTNPRYYKIYLTKDQLPYILVDGTCYVLLGITSVVHDSLSFFDLSKDSISIDSSFSSLLRFPWQKMWSYNLDNFEEILKHHPVSTSSYMPIFLYYMGLGENAIQYVEHILTTFPKTTFPEDFFVQHHRVDARASVASLYFPLDLVIDYPCRDVAEYLKSLFFYNDYDFQVIEDLLLSLKYSSFGYSLLFGRLLYPSFFFDACADFFSEKKEESSILLLGERREEYRIFLREIYYIIRKKVEIEEVRWIVRD